VQPGMAVQFLLHKACQVRAEHTRFMCSSWPIISDGRVLSKRNTSRHDLCESAGHFRLSYEIAHLVGKCLEMVTHEIAAVGVKKDEETRRIAKGDQLSLLGVEVYIQSLKICDLLARHWEAVYPPPQNVVELYKISILQRTAGV